jgi:hypothetical protein
VTLSNNVAPPWRDPLLERAVEALAAGDPVPAFEALAGGPGDHDRREFYADALGRVGQHHLTILRTNAQAVPDDPRWWLLLGSALIFAAWSARGAARARDTSDTQMRGLVELARESREALHRSAALAPEDPVPWTLVQSIAKAAPTSSHEVQEVWERIQALAPDSFAGSYQRLSVLCRKWYGSTERMLGFMRERCANLPDGHPLWSLAPKAHIEVWCDGWMQGSIAIRLYRRFSYGPLKNRAARAEVDAASQRMLADSDTYAGHPWSMVSHQIFGAYYAHAGARDRARTHLERGGDRAAVWAWDLFGVNHQDELTKARRSVGL